MDAKERYFWDLTGYLILRDVLSEAEINEANESIDQCADQMHQRPDNEGARDSTALRGVGQKTLFDLLELKKPYCEIFRRLLVHPQVVMRLNEMCGKGFRHDHGPWVSFSEAGTEGLVLHGAGEPHKPFVAYRHQNGQFYCGGVTVAWQLADCKAGDGGFACVPGSHKAGFPMPSGVQTCDAPMDVVEQPVLRAGDVLFFMDGAQTHGTLPWKGQMPRRSVLYKYAGRTSARTGAAGQLSPPEIYWDEAIVEGMSEVERAVMYGPCSNPGGGQVYLEVDENGQVTLGA
jgi:ectoine hydroxylase-related dioxygenase (phytanoyl-CoA dioxygenase family)